MEDKYRRTRHSFSPAISWPILLAGVPTLGAFFAGSSEIWNDLIMVLLILFYVYKWMTGKTTLVNYDLCPSSLGLL